MTFLVTMIYCTGGTSEIQTKRRSGTRSNAHCNRTRAHGRDRHRVGGSDYCSVGAAVIGRPWPSKLSVEKARKIRELRKSGLKLKDVAERFGCSKSTVTKIVNGKLWGESK